MKNIAKSIKRVGLVGNSEKANCGAVLARAAQLLARSDRKVFCDSVTAQLGKFKSEVCADTAALARKVDLIVVFGGDGTMLRVAREVAGTQTPLLGINIGGLGFLTAFSSAELPEAFKQIWGGNFSFEERALVTASYQTRNGIVQRTALNDIVISRGSEPRLIELEVRVDNEPLTHYRCDGLIVSSPTGSTAYSLAAGGAIVCPTADVFTLTPICPHTLSNRSVIVSLDSTIQIKVLGPKSSTILSADGQVVTDLSKGDSVIVNRSKHSVRLMKLDGSSFFQTLRHKLSWRGTNF